MPSIDRPSLKVSFDSMNSADWRTSTGGIVNGVCASCCPQSVPTDNTDADAEADEDVAVNSNIDDE